MKVKELRNLLKNVEGNMEVIVWGEGDFRIETSAEDSGVVENMAYDKYGQGWYFQKDDEEDSQEMFLVA